MTYNTDTVNKRFPIWALFDTVAGSGSGSITAGMLSHISLDQSSLRSNIKTNVATCDAATGTAKTTAEESLTTLYAKQAPTYMAKDVLSFFSTNAETLFQWAGMEPWLHYLIWALIAFFMAILGWVRGRYLYDNAQVKNAFETLGQVLSNIKRKNKGMRPKYFDMKQYNTNERLRQDPKYTKYLSPAQQSILIQKLSPYCEFNEILKGGDFEDSLRSQCVYLANARRRFTEEKPKMWQVMIEYFIIGVIAGYYLPLWIGEAAAPNSRVPIATLMNTTFPITGNTDFEELQTNEVLLTAYNYQQQNAQFFSNWFTK
jgi:hypothetical protein